MIIFLDIVNPLQSPIKNITKPVSTLFQEKKIKTIQLKCIIPYGPSAAT